MNTSTFPSIYHPKHNTLYLDFIEDVGKIPTHFKIYLINDDIYIYVTQYADELLRYDNSLSVLIRNKRKVVYCQLKKLDDVKEVAEIIHDAIDRYKQ